MEIPSGYGQVNLLFGGSSLPTGAQCTFGIDIDAFGGDPEDAGAAVVNAWTTASCDGFQTTTTTLTGVLVKFGPVTTGPAGLTAASVPGGISSTGTSPAVAVLVRKNTSFGGRAGRGRMFLPGVSESDVSIAGLLDGAYVSYVNGALASFLTELSTALIPMVLLHGDGSAFPPYGVTGLSCQGTVATQRRRQRR